MPRPTGMVAVLLGLFFVLSVVEGVNHFNSVSSSQPRRSLSPPPNSFEVDGPEAGVQRSESTQDKDKGKSVEKSQSTKSKSGKRKRKTEPVEEVELPSESSGSNSETKIEKLGNAFIRFNRHEATQVKHGMTVQDYLYIQQVMYLVVQFDHCGGNDEDGRYNCVQMFRQFKTIPKEHRGPCKDVYMANCYKWPQSEGKLKTCAFFVKTSPGETTPVMGEWWSLADCTDGMPVSKVLGLPQEARID